MNFNFSDQKVSVACTWGEGPDVLFDIHRSQKHFDRFTDPLFVPLDLKADEAIELGQYLIHCGVQAMKMDADYLNYCIDDTKRKLDEHNQEA